MLGEPAEKVPSNLVGGLPLERRKQREARLVVHCLEDVLELLAVPKAWIVGHGYQVRLDTEPGARRSLCQARSFPLDSPAAGLPLGAALRECSSARRRGKCEKRGTANL